MMLGKNTAKFRRYDSMGQPSRPRPLSVRTARVIRVDVDMGMPSIIFPICELTVNKNAVVISRNRMAVHFLTTKPPNTMATHPDHRSLDGYGISNQGDSTMQPTYTSLSGTDLGADQYPYGYPRFVGNPSDVDVREKSFTALVTFIVLFL